MNLTEELRASLREHAEAAPEGNTLMTNVRYREMRSRRRRRLVIGATSATVVLALAIAIPLFNRKPQAQTAAPAPSPPALGPAGDYLRDLPVFPYTPGWLPPELGTLSAGLDSTYLKLATADQTFVLSVGQTHAFYPPLDNAKESAVTVSGRPASLRTGQEFGEDRVQLFWQDNERFLSLSARLLTTADAIRFAENLQPGAVEIKPGLRVGLLPPKHRLVAADPASLCFAPSELYNQRPYATMCLRLGEFLGDPAAPVTPVQVRGRTATLSMSGGFNLTVPLRAPLSLFVHAERASIADETILKQLVESVMFTDPSLE